MSTHLLWEQYLDTRVEFVDYESQCWSVEPAENPDSRWPLMPPAFDRQIEIAHIITAWNPGSEQLDDEVNRTRNTELRRQLQELGFESAPAIGYGRSDDWSEESIIVFGADRAQVVKLAAEHGQNAIFEWTPQDWIVVGVLIDGERHAGWTCEVLPDRPIYD